MIRVDPIEELIHLDGGLGAFDLLYYRSLETAPSIESHKQVCAFPLVINLGGM